ncbi:DUF4368 domain-containing protein [Trueperella sp. zg.1013]|nr:DUF4368 domain-containing protein [Trueperella sp. zg.1013]
MEFYEHRRSDYLSKIADVIYNSNSLNERWNSYIDEILSGDKEKSKFLQKILGYGLTGDTRHECMAILYGMTTRNGKGTLCESILRVLGTYACASRPETLALKNKVNSSGPSEEIAMPTLCGAKLYQVRGKGWSHDKEYFVCASYRKQKGKCTSHQIKNIQVEEILLREIKKVTAFAKDHEEEFVDLVLKKKTSKLNQVSRSQKKELDDSKDRIAKLDSVVQNLYEDNLEGKISNQRFEKMAKAYDEEENLLQKRITELEEAITKSQEEELNVESFLKLVRKYTDIKELEPEIIRNFAEKIYVEQSVKVPGTNLKKQTIWIYWNFIGKIDI